MQTVDFAIVLFGLLSMRKSTLSSSLESCFYLTNGRYALMLGYTHAARETMIQLSW